MQGTNGPRLWRSANKAFHSLIIPAKSLQVEFEMATIELDKWFEVDLDAYVEQ